MKKELIEHLKTRSIKDIFALWDETKDYFRSKGIEMGGGYASWGKKIKVKIKGEEFKVKLEDVK